MRTPRSRVFFGDLLLSSRSGIDEVEFSIALKLKLHPHQTALIRKLSGDPSDEEEFVVGCFLRLDFATHRLKQHTS